MFKFSVMSFFSIIFISFTFAGTPPVYELKLVSNQVVKISANNSAPHIEICAYGDSQQEVIPSKWYCEPPLPEGLEIVRGEGNNNSKLYIKGIVKNITPYKRYRVFALNNGNKVKKIAPAFVDIDIVVNKEQMLYFYDQYHLKKINLENQSIIDINVDNNLRLIEMLLAQNNRVYCIVNNPIGDTFFVIKDINTSTEKLLPVDYLGGYFNGSHFVIWGNTDVIEINIDGDIVKKHEKKLKGVVKIHYTNSHYIVLHYSRDQNEEFQISIFNKNMQKTANLEIEKVNRFAKTSNGFFYGKKNDNSLYFVSVPSFDVKKMEVKNFDITNLENFAPIIYQNRALFFIAKDSLYHNYCILKKGTTQTLPMIFGKSLPKDIQYCNGYVAAVSDKTFKVFDSVNGEDVYEYGSFSGVDTLEIYQNYFILGSDNEYLFFDSSHFHKNDYEPFKLPRENFSWNIHSEQPNNIVAVCGDQKTMLIETTNAKICSEIIEGTCIAITNSFIATIKNHQLYLYDKKNLQLIKEHNFPYSIKNACYNKENNTFWGNYENIIFSAQWKNGQFQINEMNLDDKAHKIIVRDEHIFVCGEKGIHVLNSTNNTNNLHKYPHPFTGLTEKIQIIDNKEYIFLFYLQNSKDFDDACVVFNFQEQKIQNSFLVKKDGIQVSSSITNATFIKNNLLAMIFQDNHKSKMIIVNLESSDLFKIGNSEWFELSTPFYEVKIIPGSGSFAIPAFTRTFLYDTYNYALKKSLPYSGYPSGGFFTNDKFFIYGNPGTLKVLDSTSNVFMGTIRLPFTLQSYVVEQK